MPSASETDPLMPAKLPEADCTDDEESIATRDSEAGDAASVTAADPGVVQPTRKWVVEAVVLLYCFSAMGLNAVLPQYFYYRVSLHYNATANATRAFVCNASAADGGNSSADQQQLTERIQSEASGWSLYQNLVSSAASVLVLPIYASLSDYRGRKLPMLLPCAGCLLELGLVLIIVLLQLPLPLLVAASAFAGLGGGFGSLLAGVFAYLADTTTKKSRAVRIAIAEAAFGLGAVAVELGAGWAMRLLGYAPPLAFSCLCAVANVAYLLLLVPEVRPAAAKATTGGGGQGGCLRALGNIASLFSISRRLSASLGFLLLAALLFCLAFMGSMTVSSLYQMNLPFCMDSVGIGYLGTAKLLAWQAGAVAGLALLRKRLGDHGLMLLGFASAAGGQLLTALARTRVELFVAPAVGLFGMLPLPLLRAHASNQLPSNKQGALFSCVGVAEVVANLAGSVCMVLVYQATLAAFPGFVFLLASCLTAAAMAMTLGSCFAERWVTDQRQGLVVN